MSNLTSQLLGGAAMVQVLAADGVTLVNVPAITIVDQSGNAGSAGGGGAVTIADGADVTLGAKADAAITDASVASGTLMAFIRGILSRLSNALAVTGTVADFATDSGASIKMGALYSSSYSLTAGQRGPLRLSPNGSLWATIASTISTLTGISAANIAQVQASNSLGYPLQVAGVMYNGTTLDILRKPSTFSRLSASAAGGSPTLLKSVAGDLSSWWGQNGAAITYLQLYNKASAPVVGTDTPLLTYPIPANAAFSRDIPNGGAYFPTGIGYAFTTDAAGTTGAAASAVTGFGILAA